MLPVALDLLVQTPQLRHFRRGLAGDVGDDLALILENVLHDRDVGAGKRLTRTREKVGEGEISQRMGDLEETGGTDQVPVPSHADGDHGFVRLGALDTLRPERVEDGLVRRVVPRSGSEGMEGAMSDS